MNLSKRPIVLYDGVLSQLKDENNVGKYQYTSVSKNIGNNNDVLLMTRTNSVAIDGTDFVNQFV